MPENGGLSAYIVPSGDAHQVGCSFSTHNLQGNCKMFRSAACTAQAIKRSKSRLMFVTSDKVEPAFLLEILSCIS
jgi:hypothetical protein